MAKNYNLLFVFTDQQSADTMACYGNDQIKTPTLNKFADESTVFKNAFVTQPVCTPSRCSLMTGLYPHTTGCIENNIPMKRDTPTLPELSDFDDYKKAYIGKWHLGDEIFQQHGFDEWISTEDHYRKYYTDMVDHSCHSSYHDFLVQTGHKPDQKGEDGFEWFKKDYTMTFPEEFSRPAFISSQACNFLEKNKDNPFILYVNYYEPHFPYCGPNDGMYNPDDMPLPKTFHNEPGDVHERNKFIRMGFAEYEREGIDKDLGGEPLKTDKDWQKIIASYWGNVSLVDKYFGNILNTLEKCGHADDTIVVFTSDHGDMLGAHRMLYKGVMYNEAAKIPFIVRVPGTKAKQIENNVSQIDVVPTLLDAMNKKPNSDLQGYSLLPLIEGKQDKPTQSDVIYEWDGCHSGVIPDQRYKVGNMKCWEGIDHDIIENAIKDSIRTIVTEDNWKYNCSDQFREELYNLNNDPYELDNLAGKEEYKELQLELRNRIKEWQKRTNDLPEALKK